MSNLSLPKLAIIYAPGSTSLLTIRAASLGVCEIVFLYDKDCSSKDIEQIKMLENYINIYEISGLEEEKIIDILKKEDVKGILTFSEYRLKLVSLLCDKMKFPGHNSKVVEALTDKYVQRELLAKESLDIVKYCIVNRSNYKKRALNVGFPSIIKPRIGAGSKWTKRVRTMDELKDTLNDFPTEIEYILEEFLEGDPCFKDKFYGDYISVESIHQNNVSKQICITGKLPLTEYFAETGMFIPNPFSEELNSKILEVESRAIKALGIKEGITHTEIKLTSEGPKIIEINGRLGGYVSEIIKRASGIDLVKIALNVALGNKINIDSGLMSLKKVFFEIFLEAPLKMGAIIKEVEGIELVENIMNISYVEIRKQPGDIIDYRYGTENNIGVVYGESKDYKTFEEIIRKVKEKIIVKLECKESEK